MGQIALPREVHPDFQFPLKKPSGPVELDPNNRFVDGLNGCWLFANGDLIDLSGFNVEATLSGTPVYHNSDVDEDRGGHYRMVAASTHGVILGASGSPFHYGGGQQNFSQTVIFKHTSTPAAWLAVLGVWRDAGGSRSNLIAIGVSAFDGVVWFQQKDSGTDSIVSATSATAYIDKVTIVTVTHHGPSGTTTLYVNGLEEGSVVVASNFITSTIPFYAGRHQDTGLDGNIYAVYVHNDRVLSYGEVKSLHESPYQMFQPSQPLAYFTAAAAAANAPTGGIYGPLYGPLGGPV